MAFIIQEKLLALGKSWSVFVVGVIGKTVVNTCPVLAFLPFLGRRGSLYVRYIRECVLSNSVLFMHEEPTHAHQRLINHTPLLVGWF